MNKILFILFIIANYLFAQSIELDIINQQVSIPKIQVFVSNDTIDKILSNKIKKILEKDLEVSGHFDVIRTNDETNFQNKLDFLNLKNEGIDLFLNINQNKADSSNFSFSIKLYDINKQSLILSKTFSTRIQNRYPFISHRIAISVNDYFKAPSIAWMEKFVILSISRGSRKSDIVIADYTLTFQKTVITGGLNIFPKWANKQQDSFYYTSLNYNKPTLIKKNLFSKQKEIIMKSSGMIVCSDVSFDASKILITAAPNHQADVYVYDVKTKVKKRLTKYKGIDVGAHFVEDDTKIVFVSNRLKFPNIFSKKIDGRIVERLVYHGKNNSSVSTHKNLVVYVSREASNKKIFNLYLISTNDSFLKQLTIDGRNQFPKFASDGESIIFLKHQNNISSIGIIRLNHSRSYLFSYKKDKIQSLDW